MKEREKLGYKSAKLLFVLRMQYVSLEPIEQKTKGSMSMLFRNLELKDEN